MTFENGLTISVQWGFMNYCDNKCYTLNEINEDHMLCKHDVESDTAEIAIILEDHFLNPYNILGIKDPSDELYKAPYVMGYLTPDEVLDIMNRVKSIDKKKVDELRMEINGITQYIFNKISKIFP